jgi:hypothetical protein
MSCQLRNPDGCQSHPTALLHTTLVHTDVDGLFSD